MKIHCIFPKLASLVREVTRVLLSKDSTWAAHLKQHPFNFVGIKIYYTYRKADGTLVRKCTRYHVDVTRNKTTGEPLPNNSQIPGTPVATLTYGATKNLHFMRHKTKSLFLQDTKISFRQTSGTLFVLDRRDEESDEGGWHWRHMSEMGPDKEGITYSISFRSVQATQKIKHNGRLCDTTLKQEKKDKFELGKKIFRTRDCQRQRLDLEKRMKSFFGGNSNS